MATENPNIGFSEKLKICKLFGNFAFAVLNQFAVLDQSTVEQCAVIPLLDQQRALLTW
jgi:hypothetical protein